MSSLSEPEMMGTLFTAVSVMDAIGTLLSSPAVAAIFGWSLRKGGGWLGFLYFLASGLSFGVFLTLVARAPSVEEKHTGYSHERRTDEEEAAFLDGRVAR